jgi:hypothetical protein
MVWPVCGYRAGGGCGGNSHGGLAAVVMGVPGALLLLAAVSAPVTSVTVYGDRARVVRTVSGVPAGAQVVDFPLLRDNVDVSTIRVEAIGAQVQRVELERVPSETFSGDAARKANAVVEALDDRIHVAAATRAAQDAQLDQLRKLAPALPKDEAGRPAPRLDASGWTSATQFVTARIAKLQGERQRVVAQLAKLELDRVRATAEAQRLGGGRAAGGLRVRALLRSEGNARVMLSYETSAARWAPSYELQYLPDKGQVVLAFSGLVSQETGEDWENARMTLSTAHPARFERAPEMLVWHISQQDRFIPTPTPVQLRVEPAPALGAQPPAEVANRIRSYSGLAKSEPARGVAPPPSSPLLANATWVGTVRDASTTGPVAGVVVTATSSTNASEQVSTTGGAGNWEISALPPGTYALRFESEGYRPYARAGLVLGAGQTLRVDVDMLPESVTLTAAEVVVVGKPPVVEVGSTQTGLTVGSTFSKNVPAPGRQTGQGIGLLPPQAYQDEVSRARVLVAESGGLDLAFPAAHAETLRSGQGVLRVPLTTETWPVEVTRKVFPALSPQTYLVARLKDPAKGVLPAGPVALSVGTDPAGTAELPIMRPGDDLTLPLGVDRALRPIRNVQLVLVEEGVFSKEDASDYVVTLEMANPYPIPVSVTFVDQVPLAKGDNIQVKLLESKPWAREDPLTGRLEWDLVLPASGKQTASFRYRVVRPRGWKMEQRETTVPP